MVCQLRNQQWQRWRPDSISISHQILFSISFDPLDMEWYIWLHILYGHVIRIPEQVSYNRPHQKGQLCHPLREGLSFWTDSRWRKRHMGKQFGYVRWRGLLGGDDVNNLDISIRTEEFKQNDSWKSLFGYVGKKYLVSILKILNILLF